MRAHRSLCALHRTGHALLWLILVTAIAAAAEEDPAQTYALLPLPIPDAAQSTGAAGAFMSGVIDAGVAAAMLAPLPGVQTFQSAAVAALGCYYFVTHVFTRMLFMLEYFLPMNVLRFALFIVFVLCAMQENLRTGLMAGATGYTTSYLAMVLFGLSYFSMYVVVLLALCGASLALAFVHEDAALMWGRISLGAYLLVAAVNLLVMNVLETLHRSGGAILGRLLARLIVAAVIGGTVAGFVMLQRLKGARDKDEAAKEAQQAEP